MVPLPSPSVIYDEAMDLQFEYAEIYTVPPPSHRSRVPPRVAHAIRLPSSR